MVDIKDKLYFQKIWMQTVDIEVVKGIRKKIDVLRLDQMHPEISGNKWFKLRYYLEDFLCSGKAIIATFGGAFSNHIAATAAACKLLDIPVRGYIRGEEPENYLPTLALAKQEGMDLHFLSRDDYRTQKEKIIKDNNQYYWIPEGGYGELGVKGAATILDFLKNPDQYTHIFLAVGSGTTTAGLLTKSSVNQKIMAVSVMKNNFTLEDEILTLSKVEKKEHLQLLHDFHFGGYAKKTTELLDFMNMCWNKYQLPLDFVYTAKAFYAVCDFIKKCGDNNSAKILFIHTGGLQGNKSLPKDTLHYH